MGIGLGYFFAEGILIALLTALFEQFESVANYLLLRNINAFAGGSFSFAPGAGNSEAGLVQAGIVLAFYIAVLAGISIRIFQRRDVAGASGG